MPRPEEEQQALCGGEGICGSPCKDPRNGADIQCRLWRACIGPEEKCDEKVAAERKDCLLPATSPFLFALA